MDARAGYVEELASLPRSQWQAYLTAHSGLPGPRANLELLDAAADLGDEADFDALIEAGRRAPDEYLVACGVVGLGRVAGDAVAAGNRHQDLRRDPREDLREDLVARLHAAASDASWRVREAVAMALQRIGDRDTAYLIELTRRWGEDGDPLVQRAAVAGLCEPRLLRDPAAARAAVDLCELVTDRLAARAPAERRRPDVRALRKALGYCWSVAVAADHGPGLARFLALAAAASDPDVAWVVRENRRKKRLARLLPEE